MFFFVCGFAKAQSDDTNQDNRFFKGIRYQLKAGLSVGGAAPIPIPKEIRKINQFNPLLNFNLDANVTKWLGTDEKWGIRTGLRLENKGMKTDARVKNYGMEIIGEKGERVAGNWTGNVNTVMDNSYLSIPVVGVYQLAPRWNISAGMFFSYLIDQAFTGHVYEGYLREGGPTGPKVVFQDGNTASYDFSNHLRKTQFGLQVGGEWQAFTHLSVYTDLTWGVNDIFKKNFETITFNMYPIYLNVGFAYLF